MFERLGRHAAPAGPFTAYAARGMHTSLAALCCNTESAKRLGTGPQRCVFGETDGGGELPFTSKRTWSAGRGSFTQSLMIVTVAAPPE